MKFLLKFIIYIFSGRLLQQICSLLTIYIGIRMTRCIFARNFFAVFHEMLFQVFQFQHHRTKGLNFLIKPCLFAPAGLLDVVCNCAI